MNEVNKTQKKRTLFGKFLRILLWITGSFVSLIILIVLLIQLAPVQNFLTGKAVSYLSGKIHTRVELGRIEITFPRKIHLQDLYIEDRDKDTLLYFHDLYVNIDLFALLSNKISIRSVEIEKLTGHVQRNYPDTTFNFSFIADAFASTDTVKPLKPKNPGTPWVFSIHKIRLASVFLTYKDTLTGMNARIRIGAFRTVVDEFDPAKLKIHAGILDLHHSSIVILQTTPLRKTIKDSSAVSMDLALDRSELTDVKFSIKSMADTMDAMMNLGQVSLKSVKVTSDLISVGTVGIESTGFSYNNNRKKPIPSGMDYNHLQVAGLTLSIKDIRADAHHAGLLLERLAFREKCGFELKSFRTKLSYAATGIELEDLDLQTGHSRIRNHLAVKYPSLQQAIDSPELFMVNVNLDQATLAVQDLLFFVPALVKEPAIGRNRGEIISLSGRFDGSPAQLKIASFDLQTGAATRIRLDGSIKNLMHPDNLFADIQLREFMTSREDIHQLVPPDLIPDSISIPSFVEAEGSFRGFLKNFTAALDVRSSIGGITAGIMMEPAGGKQKTAYKGNLILANFDPGKLLNKSRDLGPVSLDATFSGSGLDTATLDANIEAHIQHAMLKGYDYKNFSVKGRMVKLSFDGVASMDDENLSFTYKGVTDFDPHHTRLNLELFLKNANLNALKLSADDIRISGTVKADLSGVKGENILGKASLSKVLIFKNKESITLDSVVLNSTVKNGISDITLNLPGLTAGMHGTFLISETMPLLIRHVSRYYKITDQPDTVKLEPQHFDFAIHLTDPALPEKLIPSLKKITPFEIKGSFDSKQEKLVVLGTIPQVIYSGLTIDTLNVDIGSGAGEMKYAIKIGSVYNPLLKMTQIVLGGEIKKDQVTFALTTHQSDSGTMIALSGKLFRENEEPRVKMDPALTLVNTSWTLSADNYLSFGKKGFYVHNLILSQADQMISVNSKGEPPNAPLEVRFKNFDIGLLSRVIENKTELVRGTMNGVFSQVRVDSVSGFTSDLTITGFTFQKVAVGDLVLLAESKRSGVYQVNLGIGGGENDLNLTGTYSTEGKGSMDMLLDIRKLSLKTVEPFTFGQVTRMSGTADGKINITGPLAEPGFNGSLHFSQFAFKPHLLDSYLTMEDNSLRMEGGKLHLENLTLLDTLKNRAVINGYVDLSDFRKIAFDLTLKTKNFLALNTTKENNPMIFGTVYLDSDVHILGSPQKPVINMKIHLNKGTVLTFVPQNAEGVAESEGIVAFVDSVSLKQQMIMEDSTVGKTEVTELDIKASIGLDEDVMLKMIVDPVSGDSLYVKGKADLEFSLDPSGTMSLTGRYQINDGGYHLTVTSFLKRDFRIQKGSSITWSGEPMEADVDLTAVYRIKTSPLVLLEDQMAGADDQQKNKYRNSLNFMVLLKMTGVLLKPELKFDIQLDPKDRGAMSGTVNAKLAELREDESQLNKQVFALLALNRFIGQDPLESGSAPLTVNSAARSSASKLLTSQLNALSEKYVKGVNLNVGINSYDDYSSGQAQGRTQLQLGISKELLNGRINVQVGGDIDLEGQKASQNNISDIAGNISIEYKLTEDGMYKLKGFRSNAYENPIEGELTKTGIGLIFTRDFYKVKKIYLREKKK